LKLPWFDNPAIVKPLSMHRVFTIPVWISSLRW